ncbi:MAG: hypothetical protein KGQ73_01260 [Gammaproteobacteria bacterium]|nr:hypothetical protein [Gammaproteobacteria bacterium]
MIQLRGHRRWMIAGITLLAASLWCTGAAPQALAPAAASLPATATTAVTPEPAGSAVLAVGNVTDTASDGSVRQLHDGDAIYSGDAISTGDDSYADLDFEDGGRMLLHPDTQFQIQQYHYNPAAHGYALAPAAQPASYAQTIPGGTPTPATTPPPPAASAPAPAAAAPQTEHESAFFRLLKGGLSAISGFIGHVERQDYAVETPVATIGIRGTGYELRYCESGCAAGQQGLYTGVGSGTIAVRNQAGESLTHAGNYGFIENRRTQLRHLQYPPQALQHMRLPERYRAREMHNLRLIQERRVQRWRNTPQFRRPHPGLRPHTYPLRQEFRNRPGAERPMAGQMHPQRHAPPPHKKKKHPFVRRHHGRFGT